MPQGPIGYDSTATRSSNPSRTSTVNIRNEDTGDPREYGFSEPSNRKISFLHFFDYDGVINPETVLENGITLAFRARVATGDPLDKVHPDGGAGIYPWPTEGNGYLVHDGGNANFGIRQEYGGFIGFALAMKTDHEVLTTENKQGLVMNSSNGAELCGAIKVGEGTLNIFELQDPTTWHEFWITIVADLTADGTHSVKIWADGAVESQEFAVTAGDAGPSAGTTTYLQMGMGNTAQDRAIDIDYVSYKEGTYEPVSVNVEATGAEFPREFALYNNYPNPFNPTTTIPFAMKHEDNVHIAVYNALGQLVETLLDGKKPAGIHTLTFDTAFRSSGVYFY